MQLHIFALAALFASQAVASPAEDRTLVAREEYRGVSIALFCNKYKTNCIMRPVFNDHTAMGQAVKSGVTIAKLTVDITNLATTQNK